VVFTGRRAFKAECDLRDLTDGERALIDRVFFGPAHLVDLNEVAGDLLHEESYLAVALLSLKHAFDTAMPYETLLIHISEIKDPRLQRRFLFAVLR